MRRLAQIGVVIGILFAAPLVAANPPGAVPKVEGTSMVLDTPEGRVEIRHRGFEGAPPVQAVHFEEHWHYAVGADLLTISTAPPYRIVRRVRLPARIMSLAAKSDALLIGLELEPSGEAVVRYDGGAAPGRGPWSAGNLGLRTAYRDAATWGHTRSDAEGAPPVPARQQEDALRELAEDEIVNPTNPFFPFMRGWILDSAGKQPQAKRAYEDAVATAVRHAPWSDCLYLANHLAVRGQDALSATAWEAGLGKLKDQGVRPEQITGLVTTVIVMQPLTDAVAAAVSRRDPAGVDRWMERFCAFAPNVEAGHFAWHQLAAWMEGLGRADLAAKWTERATINARGPGSRMHHKSAEIDLMLLWIAALCLGVYPAAFVIGWRRCRPESWLPAIRAVEGVALVLAPALALGLAVNAGVDVAEIGHAASAPLAVMSDGFGDPSVLAALDGFADSDAKAAAISEYSGERDAIASGGRAEVAPDPELYWQAAKADSIRRVGYDPLALFEIAAMEPGAAPPEASTPLAALPFGFGSLAGIVFFILLGGVAGRAVSPATRRYVTYAIPCGPGAAGFTTPFAVAGLFAFVLAFGFDLDRLLTSIAVPSFDKFFGLQGIGDAAVGYPARGYLVAVLLAVGALHVGAILLERRSSERAPS